MKLVTFTLLIFVFTSVMFAQNEYYLTPDGSLRTQIEVKRINRENSSEGKKSKLDSETSINLNTDILSYRDLFPIVCIGNWSIFSREIAVQWFIAPANIKIKRLAICPVLNPDSVTAEIKIVKLNWTRSQLDTAESRNWGYYPAENNGFNNITGFLDNPDRTGEWVDISGNNVPPPFAEDIWSDSGAGIQFIPRNPSVFNFEYQWISTASLMTEPIINAGEIFGIAMTNLYPDFTDSLTHRIGLYTCSVPSASFPFFKFYTRGRLQASTGADKGWWTRPETFDMAVEVELLGPILVYSITNITELHTTLSTEPQTVFADINDGMPEPGTTALQNVNLVYQINENPALYRVPMTRVNAVQWNGDIPGQSPGTSITYYIEILDDDGNFILRSFETYTYNIFKSNTQNKTLLVFNGFNYVPDGYPQEYYFGTGDFVNQTTYNFNHDVWAFGPLTQELVDNYLNIIEISNSAEGPEVYNDDVIRAWLAAAPNHNYMLAGQEWLGKRYNFANKDFVSGDFEYDILGITHSYNDVSYANSIGQNLTSLMFPVDGSLLTDSLHGAFTQSAADSLRYDPIRESPENSTDNWIDAYDVASDVIIDMFVETRGIENVSVIDTLPTLTHRTLPAGNKIAFFGYDPLYVNSSAPYVWWGFHNYAPQVQVLHWFDVINSIEDEKPTIIPENFSLEQNYPNPFNPSTTISFSLPIESKVTLKIFDLLGQEIKTLIDNSLTAGNHQVKFNADELNSGIYFYQIYAAGIDGQEFKSVKKMLLIK